MYGLFQLATIQNTDNIDPAKEIIGTKNYSLRTLDLSNGMKVRFNNSKVDSTYQDKEYYVEGVGDSITLTDVDVLTTPGDYATNLTIGYDEQAFDTRPYSKQIDRPDTPDSPSRLDRPDWPD